MLSKARALLESVNDENAGSTRGADKGSYASAELAALLKSLVTRLEKIDQRITGLATSEQLTNAVDALQGALDELAQPTPAPPRPATTLERAHERLGLARAHVHDWLEQLDRERAAVLLRDASVVLAAALALLHQPTRRRLEQLTRRVTVQQLLLLQLLGGALLGAGRAAEQVRALPLVGEMVLNPAPLGRARAVGRACATVSAGLFPLKLYFAIERLRR